MRWLVAAFVAAFLMSGIAHANSVVVPPVEQQVCHTPVEAMLWLRQASGTDPRIVAKFSRQEALGLITAVNAWAVSTHNNVHIPIIPDLSGALVLEDRGSGNIFVFFAEHGCLGPLLRLAPDTWVAIFGRAA